MSRERKQIYDLIAENGTLNPIQVAEMLGRNRGTIRRLLSLMATDGQVYKSSTGSYQTVIETVQ